MGLKKLLLSLLSLCDHDYSFPQFRVEPDNPRMGRDWQVCTQCGHERVCPIQFEAVRYPR